MSGRRDEQGCIVCRGFVSSETTAPRGENFECPSCKKRYQRLGAAEVSADRVLDDLLRMPRKAS